MVQGIISRPPRAAKVTQMLLPFSNAPHSTVSVSDRQKLVRKRGILRVRMLRAKFLGRPRLIRLNLASVVHGVVPIFG